MLRRALAALALFVGGLPLVVSPSPVAADPNGGSLSPMTPIVEWRGEGFLASRPVGGDAGCIGPDDPACDHYTLLLDSPTEPGHSLVVEVAPDHGADDLDIHVFDRSGDRVGGANTYDTTSGGVERAVMADLPDGVYTVSVQPFVVTAGGAFGATAWLAGPDESTRFTSLHGQLRENGVLADCIEAVPHPFADVLERGSPTVVLDVLVLADRLTEARARQIVEEAAPSYAELGLALSATYDTSFVASSAGMGNETGGPPRSQADPDVMLAEARAHVGGQRPEGIDAVVVITDQDLLGVSGRADCIGGVHDRATGFAVGEGWRDALESVVGAQPSFAAVVFAHELGHIFGAHHHYATCTYGVGGNGQGSQEEMCTLMMSVTVGQTRITNTSLWFSTPNALVVRSHALDFAQPNPATGFSVIAPREGTSPL